MSSNNMKELDIVSLSSVEKITESILRNCGKRLLECQLLGKTNGVWVGEQYKAEADIIANEFLMNELGEQFSGIPIVSEEDNKERLSGYDEDHFIIDPIDGTRSFCEGYAGWVTQAAYVRNNESIVAGIYAPATNEYFSAIAGQGSYYNGKKLIADNKLLKANTIIDNYPSARGIAKQCKLELGIPNYIECGSISLKICRVASQNANVFIKNMTPRDWDVAAPMLVIQEAGGILTNIEGAPLELGNEKRSHQGLIATSNQNIAKQIDTWLRSNYTF